MSTTNPSEMDSAVVGREKNGRPETVTIPVSGMTCAACSSRVQRALGRTPGVAGASVNLMLHNAVVSFDPAVTAPIELVEVIRGAGYGAEVPVPGRTAFEEQEAQDRSQQEEYREFRLKALVSLVLAVVGMLLSMPLMGSAGPSVTRFSPGVIA